MKKSIYAAAGIPEYWIVNLVEKEVEVFKDPQTDEYRHTRDFKASDRIEIAGDFLTVADLF